MSFANSLLGSLPPIMTGGSPTRASASEATHDHGLESTDCSERYDDHYTDLPAIPGATRRSPRKDKSIMKADKSPKSRSTKSKSSKSRSVKSGNDDGNDSDSSSSSGSSYSSGSDTESVFSKATEASAISYTYNAKRAIALTALATTNSIILSATTSAKMTSLEKQIKSDMKNHHKQVLIERGAAVPHVHITVDAKSAHELEVLARKTAEAPHVKSCGAAHTLQKLQRQGLSTDLAHDLEHNIDMEKQEIPSFAKKTVAGLIVDHNTAHKETTAST